MVLPMITEPCPGYLIVHHDETVAVCTEQLEGRRCPGYHPSAHQGMKPCSSVLIDVPCLYCTTADEGRWAPRGS